MEGRRSAPPDQQTQSARAKEGRGGGPENFLPIPCPTVWGFGAARFAAVVLLKDRSMSGVTEDVVRVGSRTYRIVNQERPGPRAEPPFYSGPHSSDHLAAQIPEELRDLGIKIHQLAGDAGALVLHQKNLKRHLVTVLRLSFPEKPRNCVRKLFEKLVQRRILERKSRNVCGSDEPYPCAPVPSNNDLIFHPICSRWE